MAESVRELTSAIARGDTEAFARFYRRWFDFALGAARQCSGRDEQFCLDIVQHAMMRVIRSIEPMAGEADVRRWLRTVVHSCCRDRLRAEARRARRERIRHLPHASAHELAHQQDRLNWLAAQLAAIERSQVHLLNMRFRFGWTLSRIGAALGLKPGAVDGRIQRTLSSLRAKAREDFHE